MPLAALANRFPIESQIDKLVVEPFRAQIPEVLYHYTDWAGLNGILSSGRIRATFYRDLPDDRSELRHADDAVLAALRALHSRYRGPRGKRTLARICDTYPQIRVSEMPDFNVYLACFCTESEQPFLWEKFGRRGTGYCLGLTTLKEDADFVPGVTTFPLAITYDTAEVQEKVERVVRGILSRCEVEIRNQSQLLDKIAFASVMAFASFIGMSTKAAQYSPERELRLVVWPRFKHDLALLTDPPRIEWPLRRGANKPVLTSVYVGARNAPEQVEKVRALLGGLGYGSREDLPMPEVRMSLAQEAG